MIDLIPVRDDFPILQKKMNGKPLVYFDNAATSQTPLPVIKTITNYYKNYNANIHRGVHTLSQTATDAYEKARQKVQSYVNAKKAKEIILTAGTTHGINLVANGFKTFLKKGDEIIVSALEHHSNIVPWQMVSEATGATLRVIPMLYNGSLDYEKYTTLLSDRTKLVFCNHVSNALGTINNIDLILDKAHQAGAAVLIDGAQAAPHLQIDVQQTEVDFYVISAHKMYGPTGIGALYGKESWLQKLPPYQGGGEMISEVSFEKTTYADLPHKFEAGTPNISGAIAFGAAIDYICGIGLDKIANYEEELIKYATAQIKKIPKIEIYGTSPHKTSVLSFNVKGIHPYDIGVILDQLGIAVRTGHHCAQPIMDFYKIPGTVRASFAFYNTKEEIDIFISALKKAILMLN